MVTNCAAFQTYSQDLSGMTGLAITWVRQAGQIALQHFQKVTVVRKADDTLLTQADVDIEEFLTSRITAAYPHHNLVAEETRKKREQTPSPYTWVIDPLDGTTAFVQALPGWGISLGLLYADRPVLGLFYMPLLNDLTWATAGNGSSGEQHTAWAVRSDWRFNGFLAVSAGAHHDFQIKVSRTRALGSAGASLVYTARGSAAAAFIPRAYIWDLAAGAVILKQAGGELRYLSGRPVDCAALLDGSLAPEPILAGHPILVTELQQMIRPWQAAPNRSQKNDSQE